HLRRLLGAEGGGGGREADETGLGRFDAGLGERLADGAEGLDRRGDDEAAVLAREVFRAGLGDEQEQLVLVLTGGGDLDLALPLEEVGDGAARAEVAAVLREGVADVGDGAVGVVREALDEEGDAAGAVALVRHLLVVGAGDLARAALDGAFDVVLGHVLRLRLVHGEAEAGVHVRVAAAFAGGYHDVARDARPELRAPRVGDALLAFDLRPFIVSCHRGIRLRVKRRNIHAAPARPMRAFAGSTADSLAGRQGCAAWK